MDTQQSHYIDHLAEVNKTNKVVLTEDVRNSKGALVVKKGVAVDRTLAAKLAKHKLIKPLENSVSLSNSLTYNQIAQMFKDRLSSNNLLLVCIQNQDFYDAFELLKLIFDYPLVVQKLTVLAHRMPERFANTIVTSVLSYPVSKQLQLSERSTKATFFACILSNIGLLHIDPEIVNKRGRYTAEEWQMLKGHVAISKHFVDLVPKLPKLVGRAILEHHERADGFGYPFAKQEAELSIEGQVVAIIDKINGLHRKLIKDGPYSWPLAIALMRLPNSAHLKSVNDAIITVLLSFNFQYKPAFTPDKYASIIEQCIAQRRKLKLWFDEFSRIYIDHKDNFSDTDLFKPIALLQMLEYCVTDSGIINDSQQIWLEDILKKETLDEQDFYDIEEFSLFLQEVEYQCWFVMKKFVAGQAELIKMFGSLDLPTLYYEGLKNILSNQ